MTSDHESQFNTKFKRYTITKGCSPRIKHDNVYLIGLVKYLANDFSKATVKLNLPRTTSILLKKIKIDYVFPYPRNGYIYFLQKVMMRLVSS